MRADRLAKAHIGHMVGPVIFDTIKRYLVYSGYEVTWVVNITDVDDKLITKGKERGISMPQVAAREDGRLSGESSRWASIRSIRCRRPPRTWTRSSASSRPDRHRASPTSRTATSSSTSARIRSTAS